MTSNGCLDIFNKFFFRYKYFLFIYLIILIICIFNSPFQSLEDRALFDSSDELTIYINSQKLQDFDGNIFDILNFKYITFTIFIKLSQFLASITYFNEIFYLALTKSLLHICSTFCFFSIVYRYFDTKIAKISSFMYLFDPYLLSLKTTMLRDDLIVSFSFILFFYFINTFLVKFSSTNLFFLISSYIFLQFLRPLHSFSLLLFLPLYENIFRLFSFSKYFFSKFNFKYKIKSLYLFLFFISLFFLVLFSLSGYYINYAFYLLKSFDISYIYLAIKNFYFSPLPSNVLRYLDGFFSSDISYSPYWFLFRFYYILLPSLFLFIISFFNFKKFMNYLSPLFILSLSITVFYAIFSTGEITLGPRQGYFCYLLITPTLIKVYSLFLVRHRS